MRRVVLNSSTHVAWFPGSSSSSIEAACKHALDLPIDATIRITHDGCVVLLNEHMPDGLHLQVEHVKSKREDTDLLLPVKSDLPGQMLKFERINAHLANERTWLAWVRTALSLASCALTMRSTRGSWHVPFFVIGALFVACVDLSWFTGWARYRDIKDILALPKDALPDSFHRVSLRYHAIFIGLLFAATLFVYVGSAVQDLIRS